MTTRIRCGRQAKALLSSDHHRLVAPGQAAKHASDGALVPFPGLCPVAAGVRAAEDSRSRFLQAHGASSSELPAPAPVKALLGLTGSAAQCSWRH